MDTCTMDTCIMGTYIMDTCIMDTCIMDTCIMDTCIMDTSAWVTQPERPKGVKDEVKEAPTHLMIYIGKKFQKVENEENRFFAITSSKL